MMDFEWKPSVETVLRCISTFSGLNQITLYFNLRDLIKPYDGLRRIWQSDGVYLQLRRPLHKLEGELFHLEEEENTRRRKRLLLYRIIIVGVGIGVCVGRCWYKQCSRSSDQSLSTPAPMTTNTPLADSTNTSASNTSLPTATNSENGTLPNQQGITNMFKTFFKWVQSDIFL